MTEQTALIAIANHYGEELQKEKLIEEMAELIVAIRHDSKDGRDNYIEELADVSIMIDQLIHLLNDEERVDFFRIKDNKIQRTLKRIEDELAEAK